MSSKISLDTILRFTLALVYSGRLDLESRDEIIIYMRMKISFWDTATLVTLDISRDTDMGPLSAPPHAFYAFM